MDIRIFLIQWEEELQELPQALESRNVSPPRKDETSIEIVENLVPIVTPNR